jgi:hypothetical protein
MVKVPVPGFQKYWTQNIASLKSEWHAIISKYPEVASVVQQVYKVLSDNEYLARCTLAKVRESSEWTSIVNSAEENRTNFCKGLYGKPLFYRSLWHVHGNNELKAVLEVRTQAGESCVVNNTAVESMEDAMIPCRQP